MATDAQSFLSNRSDLRCIHSGLSSKEGKDKVNCENIEIIGGNIQRNIDGQNFKKITFKKTNCIVTLTSLLQGIRCREETVHINSDHLFARLLAIAERSQEIEPCFQYQFTQEPTSLFKDGIMRKSIKSDLAKLLTKRAISLENLPDQSKYVIDCGALLHRFRWIKDCSHGDVIDQ